MNIEYEATFININKDGIRKKLKQEKAKLVKPEFLQKRVVFNLPKSFDKSCSPIWLRVRNEEDKITMSFKKCSGDKIEGQQEICLVINDFQKGVEFLKAIGCHRKSYQETKREIWELDEVEICIDEWPFLEPFVEIEGKSEKEVKAVSKKLGFDYSKAWFCAVGLIYSKKYNIPVGVIDNEVPRITFDIGNPFLKIKNKIIIGLKRGKVKLSPYNPEWAKIFEKEKKKLQHTLKRTIIDIQHIGSTAVPGMSAKPIIDIAVAVPKLNEREIKKYIKPLKKLCYKYMGEERPRNRQREHLFIKGSEKKRLCYLHMVEFDSLVWKNYLLFRDYLCANKKIRDEYTKFKIELARKFPDDRKSYTSGKEKLIKSIIYQAKKQE